MRHIIPVFLFIILSSSCTKQVEFLEERMAVSVSPASKVYLDGVKTCWNKGDQVSVFYKSDENERWVFNGNEGEISGSLVREKSIRVKNRDRILAVWPYCSENTSPTDEKIFVTVPVDQDWNGSSFSTAVLAASGTTDELNFKYCTSVLELRLTGKAEISYITLCPGNGEKIAGPSEIEFKSGFPVLTSAVQTNVKMRCNASIKDGESASFFFSVAPVSFNKGYYYIVTYKNGDIQIVKNDDAVQVLPGHVYTSSSASLVRDPSLKELSLAFSDGTYKYNPFTEPISFVFNREIGPYYYKTKDGEYPFYFYCQKDTGNSNFRITAGGGFYIGGSEGDYIKLPGIQGYRLEKIAVSLHKSSDFVVSESVGSCTNTSGGEYRVVHLNGTTDGTSYRMLLASESCFRFLSLTYRRSE